MLTDYERELSTHYAQVRKRLGYVQTPKPVFIPKPQIESVNETELATKEERKPVQNIEQWYRMAHEVIPWKNSEPEGKPTYKSILREISQETGIPEKQIVGRRRLKELVMVRRYFWYRCARDLPHMSIAEIGRRSNHDHTTVLHAISLWRRDHEEAGEVTKSSAWRWTEKV
jgi:chromosomal replication initiation ATPase DnaA